MTIKDKIDSIWLHSKYYGDMIFTAQRLYNDGEGYAATVILFNATELIFKSVRENYKQKFSEDIADLSAIGLLSDEEKKLFEDKAYGIREIRNIMTHREAYQYCLETANGKVLPFIEADTWMVLYEEYAPLVIDILYNILQRNKSLK